MEAPNNPEYGKGSFGEQAANANKGIYAAGSFGESNAKANAIVPNISPVDQAITRMRQAFAFTAPQLPGQLPPSREQQFDGRLTRVEDLVFGILAALNDATIEAVCNEDTTITITLTLPGLPGA